MAANKKAVGVVAILAVGVLAFASYSLYKYLQGREALMERAVKEAVATEKVVVAAQDIAVGTAVTDQAAATVDWPVSSKPAGAFRSPAEVSGRVALESIVKGEPIVESKLLPKGGMPGVMAYKIPEGHRAMTVGVDQVSGVAGFITPGSKVDVVLTTTPPGKEEPVSKIVHRNVPVLATGQVIEPKEGQPVVVPTVTLDVTPEEAERLAMSTSQGRLQLLLRRAGDEGAGTTPGATITRVLTEAGGVPAAPRYVSKTPSRTGRAGEAKPGESGDTFTVEVWRDGSRTVETFRVRKEG